MGSLTWLTDPALTLVADASVIINLNATGCAPAILHAIPNTLAVVDVVESELEDGTASGRLDAALLKPLVADGHASMVSLGSVGDGYFEELVIGSSGDTLDDGEAATIAYALECSAVALIDERKAMRICSTRFPDLGLASTVDLLRHDAVQHDLGSVRLADAVFNALQVARMRVLPHHLQWVLGLIGKDRAAQCPSLPLSVRQRKK